MSLKEPQTNRSSLTRKLARKRAQIPFPLAALLLLLQSVCPTSAQIDPNNPRQHHLNILGAGIQRYLLYHDQSAPSRLSELYSEGYVTELDVFVCPSSSTIIQTPSEIDTKTDYDWLRNLSDERPLKLIWEKTSCDSATRLALYSDRSFQSEDAPTDSEPSTTPDLNPRVPDWASPANWFSQADWPSKLAPLLQSRNLLGVLAGLHLFTALCLLSIARKTSTPGAWMSFVPLLNLLLLCRIAGKSAWWVILFLLPLLNLIFLFIVFVQVAKARHKPALSGVAALIPGLNLLVLLYWALGPATAKKTGKKTSTAVPANDPAGALATFVMLALLGIGCYYGYRWYDQHRSNTPQTEPSTSTDSKPTPSRGGQFVDPWSQATRGDSDQPPDTQPVNPASNPQTAEEPTVPVAPGSPTTPTNSPGQPQLDPRIRTIR